MDPNWREPPAGRVSDSAAKGSDGMNQYQSNQMMAQAATFSPIRAAGLSSSSSHTREQQFSHQYMHQLQQQQLQNQLLNFWTNQYQEIDQTTDFKNHSLPLARIKKIMKADGDVKMISADAPVIFARACEMFILELTLRSWINTEENRRRTLQKNDIATAITRTDMFDFLADIVPKDDLKDELLAGVARGSSASAGGLAENVPYYYMPQQIVAGSPYGASKVVIGTPVADEAQYKQQTHPFAAQMWPHEPQNSQPDSDS